MQCLSHTFDRGAGMQEDREGIFDTIIRNKSHYQKRAYQCIKCLVTLFTSCNVAHQLLKSTPEFKSKWEAALAWLQEELDRRPFGSTGNQYNYNWSPPAPSNDSSNGYYLERSQSARLTLSKAVLLIPEEEKTDGEEVAVDETDSPAGSSSLSSSQSQVTVFEDKDHCRSDPDQQQVEFSAPRSSFTDISRRRSGRRRMAVTRSDVGVGKCDPSDALDATSEQSFSKVPQTGVFIRRPSPVPPPSQSSVIRHKWQSDAVQNDSSDSMQKILSDMLLSRDKFLDGVSSVNREDVEEVDEVSDK